MPWWPCVGVFWHSCALDDYARLVGTSGGFNTALVKDELTAFRCLCTSITRSVIPVAKPKMMLILNLHAFLSSVNMLLGKLGASNRTQAISQARTAPCSHPIPPNTEPVCSQARTFLPLLRTVERLTSCYACSRIEPREIRRRR
jgi:hypothetical protein